MALVSLEEAELVVHLYGKNLSRCPQQSPKTGRVHLGIKENAGHQIQRPAVERLYAFHFPPPWRDGFRCLRDQVRKQRGGKFCEVLCLIVRPVQP